MELDAVGPSRQFKPYLYLRVRACSSASGALVV